LSNNNINPDNCYEYNNEPNFAVFTGKINNLILVDFDVNKKINFNTSKIDGAEWFEKKFGPITEHFGLVTKTPSGGIHAYCTYEEDFPEISTGIEYDSDDDSEFDCIEVNDEEENESKEEKSEEKKNEKEKKSKKSIAIDLMSNRGVGFQGRNYPVIKN